VTKNSKPARTSTTESPIEFLSDRSHRKALIHRNGTKFVTFVRRDDEKDLKRVLDSYEADFLNWIGQ
jgi:hypothetical protein